MDVYLKRSEKVFDGKKVREKRKEKGYSLRTLSSKSGLSLNTIRSIESMVKPTNVENLVIIADVLNCSIQDFCVFGVSLRVKDRVDDEIISYRAIPNANKVGEETASFFRCIILCNDWKFGYRTCNRR